MVNTKLTLKLMNKTEWSIVQAQFSLYRSWPYITRLSSDSEAATMYKPKGQSSNMQTSQGFRYRELVRPAGQSSWSIKLVHLADPSSWFVLHMLQIACIANCTCCKLHVLQIACFANCMCCKWHVLQITCFGNFTCWKFHVLHIVCDENCMCCKLHVF